MSDSKAPAKSGQPALTKVLYVIAALMAVIFVYMVISNISYMNAYLATYRMTFSEMWMDTIQYVITGSISYLVYAILIFCAGKIIGMLSAGGEAAEDAIPAADGSSEAPAEETGAKPAIYAAGGGNRKSGLRGRSRRKGRTE